MSDNNSEINLEDYSKDLTKSIVEETVKILSEEQVKYGSEFLDVMMLNILASLTCTMVYNKLKNYPKGSTADQISDAYQEFKLGMQNAISSGFQGAFTEFAGSSYEYKTNISISEEVENNKLMN